MTTLSAAAALQSTHGVLRAGETSSSSSIAAASTAATRHGGGGHKGSSQYQRPLTVESLPQALKDVQYAVRGPIVARATEIEAIKLSYPDTFPGFSNVVYANIGNPQRTGQQPVTYIRQLLAGMIYPELLESSSGLLPEDVLQRGRKWLKAFGDSLGCYSASKGVPLLRQQVADWFQRRDGHAANPESIFLTNGASTGVHALLELLIRDSSCGIMIPIPEYPLYTATVVRLGGQVVPYYLEEADCWALRLGELRSALHEARTRGVETRCLVIINPGNPTGAVMSRKVLEDIVTFCEEENLLLIADEVYQTNVYAEGCEFVSLRRVVKERNSPLQVASLHSASKGLFGECGLRGGLFQLENVDPALIAMVYKMSSVSLCANTIGQAAITAIVSPPQPGDPSYALYHQETQKIYGALRRKAELATRILNSEPGISCQPIQGALYAYPRLTFPPAAVAAARTAGTQTDAEFCMDLLEETGIVCVPGSGFGQAPGTWHLRMTILPEEKTFEHLLRRFVEFYREWCLQYSAEEDDCCCTPVTTTSTPMSRAGIMQKGGTFDESPSSSDEASNH